MAGLLTPEALAWIGKSEPPATEQVTRREIRKYAVATGQRVQKFLDGDEAPPMFHAHFFQRIAPLADLQEDGQVPDPLLPPLPLQRVMAGGRDVEFHRPIRPGDTLSATRTLVELYEKQGRTGPLIFMVVEMRVVDGNGRPVVTERRARILR